MKEYEQGYYAFRFIHDNSIVLDFSGCRYPNEVHKILKERFGLPEYYGKNWDALWDCLDGLFSERGPIFVDIYGFTALPKDLRDECAKMLEIFHDVQQSTPNVVFRFVP